METKTYKPKPGSANEAILKLLTITVESTGKEILEGLDGSRPDHGKEGLLGYPSSWQQRGYWNHKTITDGIVFLIKKGIITSRKKINSKSNRPCYFYYLVK